MMKAYAGPSNGRSGGNSTRSGRGGNNAVQRAGKAIRNGISNAVKRVRGR